MRWLVTISQRTAVVPVQIHSDESGGWTVDNLWLMRRAKRQKLVREKLYLYNARMAINKIKFKMSIEKLVFDYEGDFEKGQVLQQGISQAITGLANLQNRAM